MKVFSIEKILIQALLAMHLVSLNAQPALSGKITDSSGSPIPYATVYIQELKQGTTANARGIYEIKLSNGIYSVFFQSLGYNQEFRQIVISDLPVVKDVVLTEQYFQIPEVLVSSGREDPAYAIMRRAIARAPYYLNAVEHYKAMVYLKGTAIIDKVPRLLSVNIKTESGNKIKQGEKYLYESFNEIEFNAPDKYSQRLIALQTSLPSEASQTSPMAFIQASFYEPVIGGMAYSPLARNAFTHYRFSYEGASLQGQYVINKIKVKPKRKSQQLFEGVIYIIEDLWCIHSLDLVNDNIAGKLRIRQLYTPVQDDFWMPVSYSFDIDFSMIGIKGRAGYGSSVKYSEIRTGRSRGTALQKADPVPADTVIAVKETGLTKNAAEIEKLLSKEELSTRDMIKLSKLLEKESAAADTTKGSKDLEIKQKTTYIIEKDAAGKSPDYWADVRPIPLAADEIKSLATKDSLTTMLKESRSNTVHNNKPDTTGAVAKSRLKPVVKTTLFGHAWNADSNRLSVNFPGLMNSHNISFNSIDGIKYNTGLRITRHLKNGPSISVYPVAGYAFSRKKQFWMLNASLNHSGMNERVLWIRSGDNSTDFGSQIKTDLFINSMSSLLLKDNLLRLYRSQYISAGYRLEVSNGLYFELSAKAENRTPLQNNTRFSLFRREREFSENLPGNKLVDEVLYPAYMPVFHRHYEINWVMTIVPYQRYRISSGKKYPEDSDYPSFVVSFTRGLNTGSSGRSSFSRLTASATRQKDTGPMSEIYWKIRAGGIITNDSIPFQDFIHFNAQPFPVMLTEYKDAFILPQWYALSTNKWFAEAHLRYSSPYLLLKLLPGLSNTLIGESLHLKYFLSPVTRHHIEAGYSLSRIFLIAEIGIFTGFDSFRYSGNGIRLILNLNR